MRVLIVEDEPILAQTIADLLRSADMDSDQVYDGITGLEGAVNGRYDVIILDVMLPGLDGFQVVRRVREQGIATPVLMLTALAQVEDRVGGLDSGADYYLTKPFSNTELLACIRALTRRGKPNSRNLLTYGDLRLELSTCQLACGGQRVRLSQKEFELMGLLMERGGQPVAKEQIAQRIWQGQSESEERIVEVYISFLRKKLQYLRSRTVIRTLRRVGYRLETEEQP